MNSRRTILILILALGADATAAEENGQRYGFIFVDQNGFGEHAPKTFAALAASFTEYKI